MRDAMRDARWLLSIATVCAAFLAMSQAAPALNASPMFAFVVAFASIICATLLTSWFAPANKRALLWAIAPALGLLWARGHDAFQSQSLVVLASLLMLGTLGGAAVGTRIQAAGHLVFVALISSAADLFSVYSTLGPSAAMIETPTSLNLLVMPWPMLGTAAVAPILGVGDVVFASLYLSAARTHRLNATRTLLALVAGFALTFVALVIFEVPVPALPFLGLAVVASDARTRQVPLADRKHGWIGAIVLVVVAAALARYRP